MNSVRDIFAGREIIEEEMLARVKFGMIIGEVATKLGLDEPEFDTEEANYAIFDLPANCKDVNQMQIKRRDEEDFVDVKFYKQYDSKTSIKKKTFERIPKDKVLQWIDLYLDEEEWKARRFADTVTKQLESDEGIRELGLEFPVQYDSSGVWFDVKEKNRRGIVKIEINLNENDLCRVRFIDGNAQSVKLCNGILAGELPEIIFQMLADDKTRLEFERIIQGSHEY